MGVKRAWAAAFALFLTCTVSSSRATNPVRYEFSEPHMGTVFRIVVYAADKTAAARASTAAFLRIATLDNIMSDYNPESELMRLCLRAGGPPVKVSEDLFRVLKKSQELAGKSDGAFDVTVGPVVRLWRRARRQHELPDSESLTRALSLVGHDKMRLDPAARTVALLKPGMLLDLGGIGKGYAADEAMAVLKSYGIQSALIAGGGDIVVSGPPPGRSGWRIGIADLESPDSPPARYICLSDGAVSTSGDAEQHVEIGGVRYSHIVNPKTGLALTGQSSATVVAPDGATADGLATAASVLGPERGLRLVESVPSTGALFMVESEGTVRFFESRFPKRPCPEVVPVAKSDPNSSPGEPCPIAAQSACVTRPQSQKTQMQAPYSRPCRISGSAAISPALMAQLPLCLQ